MALFKRSSCCYHIVVEAFLLISIIGGVFQLVTQLMTNIMWENYRLAAFQFIGGLVNAISFLLIYYGKKEGIFIYICMMILQIPINIAIGSENITPIIMSALSRVVLLSLVFCIKKDGKSAWATLFQCQNLDAS